MNASVDNAVFAVRAGAQAVLARWRQRLMSVDGNFARGLVPEGELEREMRTVLEGVASLLADGQCGVPEDHPLADFVRTSSGLRVARGFTPEESLLFLQTGKYPIVDTLVAALGGGISECLPVIQAVDGIIDGCVSLQVATMLTAREDIIARQSDSLRDLSTPVIKLWDSILLLPLVGIVDTVRARHIAETLLDAIGQTEAEITIIDVTGVPIMDTSVARHVLKTVAAAEMLGTRVVLTGIGPETAQTIVKLGVDLSGVPTRGSLRSGIALAFAQIGRKVVPTGGA